MLVAITVRGVLFVRVTIVIVFFAGIAACPMVAMMTVMTMVQFGVGCADVPIATGFHKPDDAGRGKCELPVQKHDNQHATEKPVEEVIHSDCN